MPVPLELVSLIVDDYDAAIDFFTGPLGFVCGGLAVRDDRRPPEAVGRRTTARRRRRTRARAGRRRGAVGPVGRQFAGRVGLFLRVDDFDGTLARIGSAGCEVVRPVRDEAYGRVCVFRDPWGNLWDLLGDRDSPLVDR